MGALHSWAYSMLRQAFAKDTAALGMGHGSVLNMGARCQHGQCLAVYYARVKEASLDCFASTPSTGAFMADDLELKQVHSWTKGMVLLGAQRMVLAIPCKQLRFTVNFLNWFLGPASLQDMTVGVRLHIYRLPCGKKNS